MAGGEFRLGTASIYMTKHGHIRRRVGAWILKEISYINVLAHSPCFYKSSVINHLRYPCTNACPSHRAMTVTPTPDCKSSMAEVWRRTWGDTFLLSRDGHCLVAVLTCF